MPRVKSYYEMGIEDGQYRLAREIIKILDDKSKYQLWDRIKAASIRCQEIVRQYKSDNEDL